MCRPTLDASTGRLRTPPNLAPAVVTWAGRKADASGRRELFLPKKGMCEQFPVPGENSRLAFCQFPIMRNIIPVWEMAQKYLYLLSILVTS
jgi:hypothetical protein